MVTISTYRRMLPFATFLKSQTVSSAGKTPRFHARTEEERASCGHQPRAPIKRARRKRISRAMPQVPVTMITAMRAAPPSPQVKKP